jgi:hypothetical protein
MSLQEARMSSLRDKIDEQGSEEVKESKKEKGRKEVIKSKKK